MSATAGSPIPAEQPHLNPRFKVQTLAAALVVPSPLTSIPFA